ncbi:MAG TPA: hypothetical protein VFA07_01970 [Chthonomonadaceae bacterium]|nr:hypothetical protein [Chthonomonadaceae bacterium]
MRSLSRVTMGVLALLLAAPSLPTLAQGYRVGHVIVPASSIERAEDAGLRAHTNIVLVDPASGFHPDGGLGPAGGMTPAQMRSFYNLPSSGGSQIVAIVDAYHDATALNDFNTFSSQFGLPTETSTNVTASTNKVFQVVYAGGSQPPQDSSGGWELEESLDIEWAHAMAPSAKIVLVEANSNSFTDLFNAVSVATSFTDANGLSTKEASMSWSSGEFSGETSYDSYFTSGSVVYFASTGDSGAPAGYPSTSPYVVAAGGTTVTTNSSGNFVSESAWSSGGGGPSTQEARPSFQNAIQSIVGSFRGTPDISYDADPNSGASVYDTTPYNGFTYGWLEVGGTSWSSPALAGIMNLANTSAGTFAAGTQAELTTIYSNLGTSNFRDITTGNNGYAAAAGWDFATGVGTVQGLSGLNGASSSAPVISSLSPSSATAGGAAFTLTVNGSNFVNGATVDWNGSALTTSFVSASQLTASVPSSDIATAGSASVTVTESGQTSNTATFTINNPVPTTTSLSPSSIAAGSAQFTLTVNGANFVSASTVDWNGTALSTTFVSSTQLTAIVPTSDVATAGTANVTVVNPGPGGGTSNAQTFTITSNNPAPALSSISPSSCRAGSATFTLTCTGSNFISSSTVRWTAGGTTTVLTTTYVSGTTLTAVVPSSLVANRGTASVTVVNPAPGGGTSGALTFTIKKH